MLAMNVAVIGFSEVRAGRTRGRSWSVCLGACGVCAARRRSRRPRIVRDDYCAKKGIARVPSQNSFGHLEKKCYRNSRLHMDSLKDDWLSDRMRWQLWTLRYE